MQYLGGKTSIAKKLCEHINQFSRDKTYYEPFVGGLSVLQHVTAKARHASDICDPLIQLYLELQKGWIPPDIISEALYHEAKQGLVAPHMQAFIGFGCSFGAKWFGGYARNKKAQNYARCARNSLLKKMNTCMDVKFACHPYTALTPLDSVIYCDPPYQGTTQYGYIKGQFDYVLFWDTMRAWSKNNIVFISEYQAPSDFECVLEIPKTTLIRNKENESEKRTERLFKYKEESHENIVPVL